MAVEFKKNGRATRSRQFTYASQSGHRSDKSEDPSSGRAYWWKEDGSDWFFDKTDDEWLSA